TQSSSAIPQAVRPSLELFTHVELVDPEAVGPQALLLVLAGPVVCGGRVRLVLTLHLAKAAEMPGRGGRLVVAPLSEEATADGDVAEVDAELHEGFLEAAVPVDVPLREQRAVGKCERRPHVERRAGKRPGERAGRKRLARVDAEGGATIWNEL